MKNKKTETSKINKFTPEHVDRLTHLVRSLEEVKKSQKVNLETVKQLDNLISELLIIRSNFVENLISWTKQNYLIE